MVSAGCHAHCLLGMQVMDIRTHSSEADGKVTVTLTGTEGQQSLQVSIWSSFLFCSVCAFIRHAAQAEKALH